LSEAAEPTPAVPAAEAGGRSARLRWIAHVLRHPSAILLVVQLAGLVLYPFVDGTQLGSNLLGAFGVLVLVLAMRMVRHTARRVGVGLCLALPAVVLGAVGAWSANPAWLPWSAALESVFYFYAAGCLVAYMVADRRASTDELFAAGATFTLLVWAFTFAFVFCQAVQPGCFGGAVNPGAPRSWTELLYLSFALLSSTGIGDVIPLTPATRAIASLEMFVGVMYLTLVVSRLIGLTLLERRER
jgi:hypothetical protein